MKKRTFATLVLGLIAVVVAGTFLHDGLNWRSRILVQKASGNLPDLTWGETLKWMLPNSPVYLDLLLSNPNPSVSLKNARYVSLEDDQEGQETYRTLCAGCHGAAGQGVTGPNLIVPGKAKSEWELYRTIQRGIPGTSMLAHDLPDRKIWQIITHISTLRAATGPGEGPSLHVEPVSYARLKSPDDGSGDWLTYSGRYQGWRYGTLADINRENAGRLTLKWVYQSGTTYNKIETTPIVVDGLMFITEPPGRVLALDAGSGEVLWEFDRPVPKHMGLCCGVVNRGVAVLGRTVYVATIDAHLLALDMRNGSLQWDAEVADHALGYSITSAPIAIDGLIVTGVAGGETGTRGFLDAYDAETGERRWRFDTVPAPGEAGSETWTGSNWSIGGAATWMTGSYDPETDTLYWGTGHAIHEPEHDPTRGDKLYGSSMLALRGSTGELLWYFLATPDDIHGFDAAQVPILVDATSDEGVRRLLTTANRNGFYYVLDRESGELVAATAFVKQTWSRGLDEKGRPIPDPEARPTREGKLVWPSSAGGTNWWPPAFSPRHGFFCLLVVDSPSIFYAQDSKYAPGEPYVRVVGQQQLNAPIDTSVRCLNATTGSLEWEKKLQKTDDIVMGGLLATAGDLLFGGDKRDFFALDIVSGEELWRVSTGGNIVAAPITYRANGEQRVVVAAGRTLMSFGLGGGP